MDWCIDRENAVENVCVLDIPILIARGQIWGPLSVICYLSLYIYISEMIYLFTSPYIFAPYSQILPFWLRLFVIHKILKKYCLILTAVYFNVICVSMALHKAVTCMIHDVLII